MAHGYGKATGKPMCALLHGTIGIQHAAMSIYQAYYDRAPALLIAGRDLGFIAAHSANDMAGMVRSYTKWDATPKTLPEALAAIQRAYNEAITPPCGPTMVVIDIDLQKEEAGTLKVPAYQPPHISGLDPGQAREIAKSLLEAQNPRIAVGRLRTPDGVRLAVRARRARGRLHVDRRDAGPDELPAASSAVRPGREHVLRLHARPRATRRDRVPHRSVAWPRCSQPRLGQHRLRRHRARRGARRRRRGWPRRTRRRGTAPAGRTVDVDAEASLPALIEEVRRQMSPGQQRVIQERSAAARDRESDGANRRAQAGARSSAGPGGTRARSAPRASMPSCGR